MTCQYLFIDFKNVIDEVEVNIWMNNGFEHCVIE